MSIEFAICPKDKCPLDYLSDMEGEAVGAWIYLHDSCVERLNKTADKNETKDKVRNMYWNATDKWAATDLKMQDDPKLVWHLVYKIDAPDIQFKDIPETPIAVFFITMQGS